MFRTPILYKYTLLRKESFVTDHALKYNTEINSQVKYIYIFKMIIINIFIVHLCTHINKIMTFNLAQKEYQKQY